MSTLSGTKQSAFSDYLENPTLRLYGLLFLVILMEGGLLLAIHVTPSVEIPDKKTEPIRITLTHPPAPPKPIAKPTPPKPVPHQIKKVVRRVHPQPKATPPVLPAANATSENQLVASVGNEVSLGWGSAAPAKGTPSDFISPQLLTKVDTSNFYTQKMKDSDEEGDVVIEVWVDPKGAISHYKLLIPSVYDDINHVSLGILKTLKFAPATYKGNPVEGQFQLNFRFRIQNS
ncbi:TonB family protein [Leptospirillum ferrooxidans]|jgi:protein TonB|uniref:Putative TonB-like protein n=1 Tax=Leptospirillum ferrooxidans (strain C2-3) TaxID=1162668 RepID=I0ILA2_LEPFC|nr:TonB family protein [Leptospirillum ferrooxidans]BAM06051.1 putative TonB-like protein [Leptospirillum ferrooxidans C2-3]